MDAKVKIQDLTPFPLYTEGIEEVEIRKTDSLLALGQYPAKYQSLARRPHTNL